MKKLICQIIYYKIFSFSRLFLRNWFFRRNNYFDIYFVAEKFAEKIGCHFFPLKYSKLNQNQSFKINQMIPELQGQNKLSLLLEYLQIKAAICISFCMLQALLLIPD